MFGIGLPELIIIFIVALLVFGPKKLPELGRMLGKGLAEFRKASDEIKNTFYDVVPNDNDLRKLGSATHSAKGPDSHSKRGELQESAGDTPMLDGETDSSLEESDNRDPDTSSLGS